MNFYWGRPTGRPVRWQPFEFNVQWRTIHPHSIVTAAKGQTKFWPFTVWLVWCQRLHDLHDINYGIKITKANSQSIHYTSYTNTTQWLEIWFVTKWPFVTFVTWIVQRMPFNPATIEFDNLGYFFPRRLPTTHDKNIWAQWRSRKRNVLTKTSHNRCLGISVPKLDCLLSRQQLIK